MAGLRTAAAVTLVIAGLTGCASGSATTPTSTPTTEAAPANAEACAMFDSATDELAGIVTSDADEGPQAYARVYADFDEASLAADGDVKTRLTTLVDEFPNPPHMVFLEDEAYIANAEAVYRACTAEGVEIDPTVWENG